MIEQASIMKVRSDFMKMGGNSSETGVDGQVPFYTKVREGSADFRMKAGVGCFRRQFRRKSYDHTTVTEDQMYDIRHECNNVSKKAFQRAGGSTTQFAGTGLVDMAERRRTQMVTNIRNVDATAVPATRRRFFFFFFIARLTIQTPPPPTCPGTHPKRMSPHNGRVQQRHPDQRLHRPRWKQRIGHQRYLRRFGPFGSVGNGRLHLRRPRRLFDGCQSAFQRRQRRHHVRRGFCHVVRRIGIGFHLCWYVPHDYYCFYPQLYKHRCCHHDVFFLYSPQNDFHTAKPVAIANPLPVLCQV